MSVLPYKIFFLQKQGTGHSFLNLMACLCFSILMALILSSHVYAADDSLDTPLKVLQAEEAFLNNAKVQTKFTGFTGSGYVKLGKSHYKHKDEKDDDYKLGYDSLKGLDSKTSSYVQWNNVIDTTSCIPSCNFELKIRYFVEKGEKPTVIVYSVNKDKVIANKRFDPGEGTWEDRSWLINATQDEEVSIRIIAAKKTVYIDKLTIETPHFLIRPGHVVPKEDIVEFGQPGYENTYYGKVDPYGKRTTLKKWQHVNGFYKYKNQVIRAQYINSHDLGFGRDMNCLHNKRLSCYVENYLEPESGKPQFAATVTMEKMWFKDPVTQTSRLITAFFVFDAKGKRIDRIALDTEGPKAVPESCYSCHKGYTDANNNPQGGQYLPWDINLLDNFPGKPTLAQQFEKFRKLNRMVWNDASVQYDPNDLTQYRKKSLKDLIEGWYGGAPLPGTIYNNDLLPGNTWYSKVPDQNIPAENCATVPLPEVCKTYFTERFLYKNIYAVYCRSCHVSQGEGQDVTKIGDQPNIPPTPANPNTRTIGLDWSSGMAFWNAAYTSVCSNVKPLSLMPHAELTYNRFATDIINFTDGTSATPKDRLCAEAPPAPKTFYDVIRSKCGSCHTGFHPGFQEANDLTLRNTMRNYVDLTIIDPNDRWTQSTLRKRIQGEGVNIMPPNDGMAQALTSEEKTLIENWVKGGAL